MLLNCIFAAMNPEDIKLVKAILSTPKKIVITPHKNPDGDAVGSVLALWHYLRNNGHEATVIVPNDFPKFLKWMSGVDQIVNFEKNPEIALPIIEEAELIFTLDFNDLGRVGDMQDAFRASDATFVMIDHHQEPFPYAQIMYSEPGMSSTSEMVYNFIDFLGQAGQITKPMAECLYAGILTDTGSFKYSATTSQTHRVIAELIDKGAENSLIHNKIYDNNSADRLHLLGRALNNLEILPEYTTAYITLSREDLEEFHFKKGDTEGFVNYALTLEGIQFAAIFIENSEEGVVKISFRSQGNFSVNDFARTHFNGGGHNNAAGGRSDLSLKDTVMKFREVLKQYKAQLSP